MTEFLSLPYTDLWPAFLGFADAGPMAFLRSADQTHAYGRYSYLAVHPRQTIMATAEGVWVDHQKRDGDSLNILQDCLSKSGVRQANAPVPFYGGAIGAVSYDYDVGDLKRLPPKQLPTGCGDDVRMVWGIYDTLLAADHAEKKLWAIAPDKAGVEALAAWVAALPKTVPPVDWAVNADWQAESPRELVERNIAIVKNYITVGDIYQANYTQGFIANRPAGLDDVTLYRRLCDLSPAPFSAFMRWDDMALIGASPERFLQLSPDGVVEAWPIKGTRPRYGNPAQDRAMITELQNSDKDHAENLMIVDLMRSDLARVCAVGSVKVPLLNEVSSFTSVHHLLSQVRGVLRQGLTAMDVLRATFPGGSITGAPKIRAMQIIHDLEPSARGFYCGCLGWIGWDGAMDLSMTIRTITMTQDCIRAQAGGGIVADSDPTAEYEESMVKVRPLLQAVKPQLSRTRDGRECA